MQRVKLFRTKKDYISFFSLIGWLFLLSISFEYFTYTQLKKFDTALVDGVVLSQKHKTKQLKTDIKHYQILKIKTSNNLLFYTYAKADTPPLVQKHIQLEISTKYINFHQYLSHFFSYSKIISCFANTTPLKQLQHAIAMQHHDNNTTQIFQALFLATPLNTTLQSYFSNFGISHLIAISGFHLGVLSIVLLNFLKFFYAPLHKYIFPYRFLHRDLFIVIACILGYYLYLIQTPPSLLRAYGMMLIGFYLYDRGLKVFSFETLFITLFLLLALFPRLFFMVGFWLSIAGVFYIFLFFHHFKTIHKYATFFLLPTFLYLMMLPYSLTLFANFSLYHPLSIIGTIAFTLFYPLEICLHAIGYGGLLDKFIIDLLHLTPHTLHIHYPKELLYAEVLFLLASIWKKWILLILVGCNIGLLITLIYQVA